VDLDATRPFADSLPGDPDLAQRMAADGYLCLRGLLDRDAVHAARDAIASVLADDDVLASATPASDLVFRGGEPPDRGVLERAHKRINTLDAFTALSEQPGIRAVMSVLLGDAVRTHARKICRVKYPHDSYDIVGPHQDFWYVKGAEETYTCWTPLTDTSAALGGLAVRPGPQSGGPTPHAQRADSRFHGVDDDGDPRAWAWSPMRVGDALVFHSLTVHAGLPNTSAHVRLSVDYRYQRAGAPMDPSHVRPHFE
jgi:ectoine hydroxylase-related dioxygenase (phytanoyl-CoA dioxygenase family)